MDTDSLRDEKLYGIGLGSNVGDGVALLTKARELLVERASATELRSAALYRTEPVDCALGTPPFFNTVIVFRSTLAPASLLRVAQEIEVELGRPKDHGFHEPRTVDLDLLFADDLAIETEHLTLPHPRAHERLFALVPLAELCPDRVLSGQHKTVAELCGERLKKERLPELVAERW